MVYNLKKKADNVGRHYFFYAELHFWVIALDFNPLKLFNNSSSFCYHSGVGMDSERKSRIHAFGLTTESTCFKAFLFFLAIWLASTGINFIFPLEFESALCSIWMTNVETMAY